MASGSCHPFRLSKEASAVQKRGLRADQPGRGGPILDGIPPKGQDPWAMATNMAQSRRTRGGAFDGVDADPPSYVGPMGAARRKGASNVSDGIAHA